MPRQSKGRVYVSKRGKAWRVEIRKPGGERNFRHYKTEEEANIIAAAARARFDQSKTVSVAIDEYHADMVERGLKKSHTDATWYRLRSIFQNLEQPLSELDRFECQRLYDKLREGKAVDTHRNTLNQCRTFGKWLVKKGTLPTNPWAEIEGVGKRKRGKEQLTIDESRKLVKACLASDETGATATLCCLVLALRAGEVAGLTERAIDDGGRILRVLDAKTPTGIRAVEVPEFLQSRLHALVAEPKLSRHWVYRQAKRWCRLAKVTIVGAHALRGTHASLAAGAGATSQIVAGALGHASTAVTEAHYAQQEARDQGKQKAALRLLAGGKS